MVKNTINTTDLRVQHIILALINNSSAANDPEKEDGAPEPDDLDKFPDETEEVENLPPLQPDVDPLERDNPDADELEDNEPLNEHPDEEEEIENHVEQVRPTGQTIVVDRHIGKDGM